MTDRKYKKWDEIVNPALERSRKKQISDPLEVEIEKAMDMDDEKGSEGDDVWGSEAPSEPVKSEEIGEKKHFPGAGGGDDVSKGAGSSGTVPRIDTYGEKDGSASSMAYDTPESREVPGEREGKGQASWSGFDPTRGSEKDENPARKDPHVEIPDMTDEERADMEKKKKKIAEVMGAFVDWKESQK